MTIRKEIKSQIVNIRGKIKCLPKDSMGTGGTSGGLIWPMRDEVVDGLTNIIRKLDEGDISLDNNGSDSNTSCSSSSASSSDSSSSESSNSSISLFASMYFSIKRLRI